MAGDFLHIILALLMVVALSGLSAPWLLPRLRHWPDAGWSVTTVAALLMISLPVWFLGHLGLAINTRPGIWLVVCGLAGLSFWQANQNWPTLRKILLEKRSFIALEIVLLSVGFIYLSFVRSFAPDINGLEKFMDAGFIVAYQRSATLPMQDMWLSGYDVNYYTFGHFMGSVLTFLWGLEINLSYNLLLGFVLGVTLQQTAGLVMKLAQPFVKNSGILLLSAGVGAFITSFAGNSHTIWSWLSKRTLAGYWYPDATRFIPFTIHEFPAYSYIVSDLHGHVWGMLLVFPMILALIHWVEQLRQHKADKTRANLLPVWVAAAVLGGLLGIAAATSTWDTMIYGLLCVIVGLALLLSQPRRRLVAMISSGVVGGLAFLLMASPWLLNFESISEGVRLVTERSLWWHLLVLWAIHLSYTLSALALGVWWWRHKKLNLQQQSGLLIVLAMIILAWILLALPELIFFKDIYPGHPRANTMFKFTFQSFIVMSVLGAWALAVILSSEKLHKFWRWGGLCLLALGIGATSFYTYFGLRDYYGSLKSYRGLDGLVWLKDIHPNDYAAMMWLKQRVLGRPVILEAVGESYTTFARVSTFTGLPTVLGWRVHEWLWRGSFDLAGERTPEVQKIYEQPNSPESKTKLSEYDVRYIFVGDKEVEAYPDLDKPGLRQLGRVVFERGETFIVAVAP